MANADQRLASRQITQLMAIKRRLTVELDQIRSEAVVARRAEINGELSAVNSQIDAVRLRLPPGQTMSKKV